MRPVGLLVELTEIEREPSVLTEIPDGRDRLRLHRVRAAVDVVLQIVEELDEHALDHSLLLFGSSISESNIHTHDDLPIVLAGTANGQLRGNRHLVYSKETPLNNLFLNMFDLAGIPHVDGFGDSTGRLAQL